MLNINCDNPFFLTKFDCILFLITFPWFKWLQRNLFHVLTSPDRWNTNTWTTNHSLSSSTLKTPPDPVSTPQSESSWDRNTTNSETDSYQTSRGDSWSNWTNSTKNVSLRNLKVTYEKLNNYLMMYLELIPPTSGVTEFD